MKTLFACVIGLISAPAFSATHSCVVKSTIHIYDAKTLALKYFETVQSDDFVVSEQPHEEPKVFSLVGSRGLVGEGTVMTGTLLDTNEGNVIQAQANLSLYGVQGVASLVMALDSPMAKAITTLEKETAEEFYLMPFDIKCSLK